MTGSAPNYLVLFDSALGDEAIGPIRIWVLFRDDVANDAVETSRLKVNNNFQQKRMSKKNSLSTGKDETALRAADHIGVTLDRRHQSQLFSAIGK